MVSFVTVNAHLACGEHVNVWMHVHVLHELNAEYAVGLLHRVAMCLMTVMHISAGI